MDPQLKDRFIAAADEAFLALAQQIQHQLDLIQLFVLTHPDTLDRQGTTNVFLKKQLEPMVKTLGSLPALLADQIRRWKVQETRLLSKAGIDQEVIGEIWITLEVLTMFFVQQDHDLNPYNRSKAEAAVKQLQRMNRLLD